MDKIPENILSLYHTDRFGEIYQGDCLEVMRGFETGSVNCGVTSPPYWGLRDYGVEGQYGLEKTPEEYVDTLVGIFREFRRVLKDDGTLWLNLGDSYVHTVRTHKTRSKKQNSNAGIKGLETSLRDFSRSKLKTKDLVGIPWRVAFALQADGWYLRQDIIWHKPNPMPESVRDRCTKAHEYIFLLSKSPKYYYDHEAIKEKATSSLRKRTKKNGEGAVVSKMRGFDNNCGNTGIRNKRSVWTVPTKPFKGAHFSAFPPDLISPCILAGCPENGVVMDMFFGSGTTGLTAKTHNRRFIGIELVEEYCRIAVNRIAVKEPDNG